MTDAERDSIYLCINGHKFYRDPLTKNPCPICESEAWWQTCRKVARYSYEQAERREQAESEIQRLHSSRNHGCYVCAGEVGIPAGISAGLCRRHAEQAEARSERYREALELHREQGCCVTYPDPPESGIYIDDKLIVEIKPTETEFTNIRVDETKPGTGYGIKTYGPNE